MQGAHPGKEVKNDQVRVLGAHGLDALGVVIPFGDDAEVVFLGQQSAETVAEQ